MLQEESKEGKERKERKGNKKKKTEQGYIDVGAGAWKTCASFSVFNHHPHFVVDYLPETDRERKKEREEMMKDT